MSKKIVAIVRQPTRPRATVTTPRRPGPRLQAGTFHEHPERPELGWHRHSGPVDHSH